MERTLKDQIRSDLRRKLVFLVGPRQIGKTTLAKSLMTDFERAQYLNWDVPGDRRIIADHAWSVGARLVILDEIHKMRGWKAFLKGAWDGRAEGQALLVTGSARMDTFRQGGESLAGRYVVLRLHPVTVREWCAASSAPPQAALDRILERGGFPEPFLAESAQEAERWRRQYAQDLIREDVVEFSRVHEIGAMRHFVQMLRERVGSPVSLASIARALQVAPKTLARYLEILEALYVVFAVRPFHRNLARAILKEPKIYFFDTGMVTAGEGARFENACAALLLAQVHRAQDLEGRDLTLHYVRQKQGAEVDFAVCDGGEPVTLAECKLSEAAVPKLLVDLAARFPGAQAVQLVHELRQEQTRGAVSIVRAADWLARLAA